MFDQLGLVNFDLIRYTTSFLHARPMKVCSNNLTIIAGVLCGDLKRIQWYIVGWSSLALTIDLWKYASLLLNKVLGRESCHCSNCLEKYILIGLWRVVLVGYYTVKVLSLLVLRQKNHSGSEHLWLRGWQSEKCGGESHEGTHTHSQAVCSHLLWLSSQHIDSLIKLIFYFSSAIMTMIDVICTTMS